MENLSQADRNSFEEAFHSKKLNDADKIEIVRQYFEKGASNKYLKELMDKLMSEAAEVLKDVNGSEEVKSELINLTQQLIHRDK